MDNNLRRQTSTPISDTVKKLNEQIVRENQLMDQGYVGNKASKAEPYIPLNERERRPRKWKLDVKAKIGMVLVPVSLAGLLVGSLVQPTDVGFVFDYNSSNISITQEDPNDYHTKNYDITMLNGDHASMSFDELDSQVPRVEETETMVNVGGNTPVGVMRKEEYPMIKGIIFPSAPALLVGAALTARGLYDSSRKRR